MYFDASSNKQEEGVGVVLISPIKEELFISFNPNFETRNNLSRYEALCFRLEATRRTKINQIVVFGDLELIVQQIKAIYQTKCHRMKS